MASPVDVTHRLRAAGLRVTGTGDNHHHHLVCRPCGDTTDVDRVVGTRPCLVPSDSAGYLVAEAEVVFWGTCPRCRRSRHPNQHQKETP
jgi:Fur family ferric uptake transcriptional regulator